MLKLIKYGKWKVGIKKGTQNIKKGVILSYFIYGTIKNNSDLLLQHNGSTVAQQVALLPHASGMLSFICAVNYPGCIPVHRIVSGFTAPLRMNVR